MGGLTGFLDGANLVNDFDASVAADLDKLMGTFLGDVLDEEQPDLGEIDLVALAIDPATLPQDVLMRSEFGYSGERLVRLDAIAFRRGNVAAYLLAVSVVEQDVLIDIPAITTILEDRLRNYSSDTF